MKTKSKNVKFGNKARKEIQKGINTLVEAVKITLGAQGRYVTISNKFGINQATKDGVTVAKAVEGSFENPFHNMGSKMVSEVCIKVADEAGDGTTTAGVLTQSIYNEGIKYIKKGYNPVLLKKGIELAVKEVVKYLKKISEKVTLGTIKNIAVISANNDEQIGSLITEAVEKIGMDSVITLEPSNGVKTYVEVVEGLEFENGYMSHSFITNPDKMITEMENCAIFLYDGVISSIHQLLPVLKFSAQNRKSLLIMASEISGEVVQILSVNKVKERLPIVAVKSPYFGNNTKEFIEDISILTGASVFSEFDKFNTKGLGFCGKLIVKKDSTIILQGTGEKNKVIKRVNSLKKRLKNVDENIIFLNERISKLSGGIGIIYVGGNTELEMKERFDRVEDALLAVKSAVSEGIVSGGGIAYLEAINVVKKIDNNNVDINKGFKIVIKALQEPFKQIIRNSGENPKVILKYLKKQKKSGIGYDVNKYSYVNMKEKGIIDPVKVSRVALESASSIASILLTTECSVIN